MQSDGANAKQLTADAHGSKGLAVSPDGRYLVFASNRLGAYNIWRADRDGSNLVQLTDGSGELYPRCSPDGKWVVYQQGYGNVKATLWRVPIEGGEPALLTDAYAIRPALSPDGKLIAYFYMDRLRPSSPWMLGVISAEGGALIKSFDIPATVTARVVRWSPDSKALVYINDQGGVSNLWSQPLDQGAPKKLTDFKTHRILAFEWSPDGRILACSRGIEASDVVLLSDLRQ